MGTSSLKILVVEDNNDARELLREMLKALGHEVLSVSCAEGAIAPLRTGRFDVLLADINLPKMSGLELAQMAVRELPELKVIFASGYGYLVADKMDFEFVLLPKPYDLFQLRQALEAVFTPPFASAVSR